MDWVGTVIESVLDKIKIQHDGYTITCDPKWASENYVLVSWEPAFKKYDKVLVRDKVENKWNLHFYNKFCPGDSLPHKVMTGSGWKYCIPFDEEIYENQ